MAKNRLGKGLDALLGDARPKVDGQTGEASGYREVDLNRIQPNPNQPRRTFNDDTIKELADSLKEQGMMQPILVRPQANGGFQIISGERRWRAAKEAGLETVPVIEREADDTQVVVLGLVENLQREDLNALDAALAIQRLRETYGLRHEDIAAYVGKSRSTITNSLRLLTLVKPVQSLLQTGELEEGTARTLLGLPEAAQLSVARRAIKERLSVRQVEQIVAQHGKPGGLSRKDPDVARLEEELSDQLGSSVNITSRGKRGGGTLSIKYRNLAQLQTIIERIKGS